mgnify:CR=1 FL=1
MQDMSMWWTWIWRNSSTMSARVIGRSPVKKHQGRSCHFTDTQIPGGCMLGMEGVIYRVPREKGLEFQQLIWVAKSN